MKALLVLLVFGIELAAAQQNHLAGNNITPLIEIKNPETVSCPSENFTQFLNVFSESAEIQRIFTTIPLKYQKLDLNSAPEPTPVIRLLLHQQIRFPLIPTQIERLDKSLKFRIDKLSKLRAKVTLLSSDSDYQIVYIFSKNICWKLEAIEDWSF